MKMSRAIAFVLTIALVATLGVAAMQVETQAAPPPVMGDAVIELSGRIVQVIFNRNGVFGGTDISVSRWVMNGSAIGSDRMPTFVAPAGRTFTGWSTTSMGPHQAFTADTVVDLPDGEWEAQVYARWGFTSIIDPDPGPGGNGGGEFGTGDNDSGPGGGGTNVGGGGGAGGGGGSAGGGGGAAGGGGAGRPPGGGMDVGEPGSPPMGGDGGLFDFVFGGEEAEVAPPPTLPGAVSVWESQPGGGRLEDTTIPSLGGVLLYSPEEMASWSLVNLILAAIGAIFAAMITIRALIHKKNENEEDGKEKQHRLGWFVGANVLGILGAVLFVIFQDMSTAMVLLDRLTIVHAAIFAVQVVAIYLLLRKSKSKDGDHDDRGLELNMAHA